MIEEMYTEEVNQQSEAKQNPTGTRIKPEKNTTESATTLGGESHLLGTVGNPNSLISSSIVTDGDQFHCYPNLHGGRGGAVSLTLGLQQQPFSSSMMQQQRSLMLQGDGEEVVLPYRNLMGSHLLHDFAG
uniref:Uncharacterized protein n=1 Tax=Arundo donax TaxID=35708 RepID=A0A0A9B0X6_ARUDO